MKIKILTTLFFMFLAVTSCFHGDDLTLGGLSDDDSIIAHYPLDGNAKDISGNGHDGELYDAAPYPNRYDQEEKALYFYGMSTTSSYVDIPSSRGMNLSNGPFSVSFFTKILDTSFSTKIITVYDNTGSEFFLVYTYGLYIYSKFSTTSMIDASIYSSTWYFVTVVFTGDTLKLYIDGELQNSLAGISVTSFSGDQRVQFGFQDGNAHGLTGALDNLTIFNRALSEKEVKTLYKNTI